MRDSYSTDLVSKWGYFLRVREHIIHDVECCYCNSLTSHDHRTTSNDHRMTSHVVVSHSLRWYPMSPCDNARDRTTTHDHHTTVIRSIVRHHMMVMRCHGTSCVSVIYLCTDVKIMRHCTIMERWIRQCTMVVCCHAIWPITSTIVDHLLRISKNDFPAYDASQMPRHRALTQDYS